MEWREPEGSGGVGSLLSDQKYDPDVSPDVTKREAGVGCGAKRLQPPLGLYRLNLCITQRAQTFRPTLQVSNTL